MNTRERLLSRVLDPKRTPTPESPNLFDRLEEGVWKRFYSYHPTLIQKLLLGVGIVGLALVAGISRYYSDSPTPSSESTQSDNRAEMLKGILKNWDIDLTTQDDELLKKSLRDLPKDR